MILGKGIPKQMTARALLSAKSKPSLTFPRHTAMNKAPSTPLSDLALVASMTSLKCLIEASNSSEYLGSLMTTLRWLSWFHKPVLCQRSTNLLRSL